MTTPRELKALYEAGTNISAYLRGRGGVQDSFSEIIEASYDLQAGVYVAKYARDPAWAEFVRKWASEIARIILALGRPASILEAGVGEATTLGTVLRHLGAGEIRSYGFDLSWSRVAVAKRWLAQQGLRDVRLSTGDLLHIPFADNAVDIVYTSHSLEPNRGREEPILRELYRVARSYVLLFEPAYELGSDEARKRMDEHGYCRGLRETSLSLGYEVLEHRLFPHAMPPTNPTAFTLIRKNGAGDAPGHAFACPRYRTPLQEIGGALFSPEALAVYPVIGGIPCLRIENAILASKYAELMTGA